MALLKERLHSLYVEQLCERPRPSGRSGTSWDKILSTYRVSFENHLESLTTVEQVLQFGEKCLRKNYLKEAFRDFGLEDVWSTATPEHVKLAVVHPVAECERDIAFQDRAVGVFEQHLIPGSAEVDLNCSSFSCTLRKAEEPIDLE